MPAIQSFAPIVDDGARTLILGSIPGKASLDAEEYYAHPRNAFWKIIGELFDVDPAASYAERVQGLKSHRIAVWDAMQACTREGSLDSDIIEDSIVPNAFQTFFDTYLESALFQWRESRGRLSTVRVAGTFDYRASSRAEPTTVDQSCPRWYEVRSEACGVASDFGLRLIATHRYSLRK